MTLVRDGKGRLVKGSSSLNPSGRPRDVEGISALARKFAPEAIEALVRLMREGDEQSRARAASVLLDRGLGKPSQAVDARVSRVADVTEFHLEALKAVMKAQDDVAGRPTGELLAPASEDLRMTASAR